MKNSKGIWLITVVCMLFTFFTVRAFDNQESVVEIGGVASMNKIKILLSDLQTLEEKKDELDIKLNEYEASLAAIEDLAASSNDTAKGIQQELQNIRLVAGLLPLEGPGIEIVLNDRKRDSTLFNHPGLISYYIVHDIDLLNVINELRAAGAEAISVNDSRIMATSRISCGGPTINVGKNERFAPPFIIRAIGDSDALVASFNRSDSIYHDLKAWGLEFSIKKQSKVTIPRHLVDGEYQFAKPLKEGE